MAVDEYEPIFLDGELRFVGDEPQLCDVPTPCCDVDACLPRAGNTGQVFVDRVVLSYVKPSVFSSSNEAVVVFEIHFRALAVNAVPNAVYVYRWEKRVTVLDSDLGDIPKSAVRRGASLSTGRPLISEGRRRRIATPNVSTFDFVGILGNGYRGPEDDALLIAEGLNPANLHITVATAVSLNVGRTITRYKWRNLTENYYTYEKLNSFPALSVGIKEGARWYPGGETFCPEFHAEAPAPFPFTDSHVIDYLGVDGGRWLSGVDAGPGVNDAVFAGSAPLMMLGLVSGQGPLAGDYLLSNTGYTENNAGFRMDCTLEGNIQGIPPTASINISGITVSGSVYTPTAKPNADVNGPERILIDDGLLEAFVSAHNGSFSGSPDWNRGMAGSWLGMKDDIGCGFQFLVRTNRLKNPSLTYLTYLTNGGTPENWYKEWLWEGRITVTVNGFRAGFTSTTLDGTLFPSGAALDVLSSGGFYTRDPAWVAQAINYFTGWVRGPGVGNQTAQLTHYQIEVNSSDTVPKNTILTGPNAGQCDFSLGAPRITVDLRYWGDKTATMSAGGIIARP